MLAPLWRLILSIILLFVALLLCLVESLRVMLSRTIDRDKLKRLSLGSIDELMLRTSWDDYNVGCFDGLDDVSLDDAWETGNRYIQLT